jgi:hypothetical protein
MPMKSEFVAAREFVRGAARYHDLCYVASKGKALLEDGVAHTSAVCVDGDDWAEGVDVDWDSTAIAVARKPSEKMVLVGEDGDVATYVGGKSGKESLKPEPKLIRNARAIDGYVYACGMLRQVYRRAGERKWVDISAPAPKKDEEVGFEAIDGFDEKEIYAVGWQGEIWQYDGKKWKDRTSPTNVILAAVCCAGDDYVYAAGQQGVMLRGRNAEWELIEWEEEVDADLWDLCWFENKLYVASATQLFTLEGNNLVAVDFGELEAPTCFSLTTADGVLWSIGKDDVASFDGTTWRLYE